ncbi:MAG: hypothetical protein JWP87_5909 [Labilithrix sp.]|nr:hypothetical protein [Labilithrix sp.]
MGSEIRVGLAVVLAIAMLSATAHAEPTAADRETARSLMAQARDQRDKGDLAGALKSFQAADTIMHVPTTAFEVAKTQVALGLLIEARESLAATLRTPASPSDPAPFAAARKNAESLDDELAKRIPSVLVNVSSADPGAALSITIDDLPIGANLNGVPRKLNPGHHVVVARAGGAQATAAVDLAAGDNKTVELVLSRATSAPAPNRPVDEAPPASTSRGIPALAYVGFGVGAAGVVAGSITGLLSIGKKGDLETTCPDGNCPRSAKGDLDSARTLATVSNVSFVIAGVGAVVGLVAILVAPSSAPSATTTAVRNARRVTPYATVNGAGLAF